MATIFSVGLKKVFTLCYRVAFGVVVAFAATHTLAAVTGWDFDNGTLQGWTTVTNAVLANCLPEPVPISYEAHMDPGSGSTWRPNGYTQGGLYMAAVTPFDVDTGAGNTTQTDGRDAYHDAPLVFRSPAFSLTGSGQIGAHLMGGSNGAAAALPSNFSQLTGPAVSTSDANDTSLLCLALRRESTGDYVLSTARTNNSSSSWVEVGFSESELQAVNNTYPGEQFMLDLIDTAYNSFGSLALDSVTIPATSNSSLITGGGKWAITERIYNDTPSTTFNLPNADTLFALPSDDPSITVYTDDTSFSVVNLDDGLGNIGVFSGGTPFLLGTNRFAAKATGVINVITPGTITFGFYANDGGRLVIDGVTVAEDSRTDYGSPSLGSISLTAGAHAVEFLAYQNINEARAELFVATTLGDFDSINDSTWDLLEASDLAPPTPLYGDYNNNGVVDAADYVVWRKNFGGTSLPNESASLGVVDDLDYAYWRSRFGETTNPPGAGRG